ncbi:MAG: thiamine phosphate synthase [Thermoplasmata archaeon]
MIPKGIYGITTSEYGFNHIESAKILLDAGIRIIQYREKNGSGRKMYDCSLEIKKICEDYGALLIINDRVDIALAVDADGVHVGQKDLPADITRKIIGKKIMGVSVSSVDQASKAVKDGADYLGAGAIFSTNTKNDSEFLGIENLKKIIRMFNTPIVAIGGIKLEDVKILKEAGVHGIAVISAIFASGNPVAEAKKFVEEWES